MEIQADRRVRRLFPDAESASALAASARRYLEEKVRLARLLVQAERAGAFLSSGYANVSDFAARELGLPRRDLPLLLDLGRSLPLEVTPPSGDQEQRSVQAADGSDSDAPETLPETVEERIAGGRLSVENAAALGELSRDPGMLSETERAEWARKAEATDPRQFRRDVRKRVETAKQAERTVAMHLEVTESVRDDFHRARTLASRSARRLLTDGQVFAVVVRSYIRAEDGAQRGEKRRRVPDTTDVRSSRYVPAEVQRAVRYRADDRCEVPGCSHGIFLELMHVVTPHAQGGSREVDNLALGCSTHHVLLDAGVIRFDGWSEDGHPRFVGPKGGVLTATGATTAVSATDGATATARAASRCESRESRESRLPPESSPELWVGAADARGPP